MKFAALFVLFANAFSAGMMFLASVFISRYGGKELFGFFSVVLGVVMVGAKTTTLGLDVAIVRFLPKYRAEGAGRASGGIQRFAVAATILCSLTVAAAFAVLLHFGRGFSWDIAITASISLPLAALLAVFQNIIRANGNVSRAVIGEVIVRPATFMFLIVAIQFFLSSGIGLFWISLSYSVALALALSAAFSLVLIQGKINWTGPVLLSAGQLREWLSHGLNLLLSESATVLLNQAPILLAGLLLSAAQAGEMSAVIRLAMLVIFALTAVQSIITPFLSKAMTDGNRHELQALVARASAFTMLVAVPVCGGFIVLAPLLLSFFGEGYNEAVPLLRIMLVAYFLYASAGPAIALLTMTGQHKIARQVVCWAAVILIVAGAVAMLWAGLAMAVWVTAGVIAIYPHVLAMFCRKTLGVDPTVFSLRFLVR